MSFTNNPCRICGATHYTVVEVMNSAGMVCVIYADARDTGKRGPFGGSVMSKAFNTHARVCENCGNVTMYSSYNKNE